MKEVLYAPDSVSLTNKPLDGPRISCASFPSLMIED